MRGVILLEVEFDPDKESLADVTTRLVSRRDPLTAIHLCIRDVADNVLAALLPSPPAPDVAPNQD